MITNKAEYDNVKGQVERQKAEITRTRVEMDALEQLVAGLEAELEAVKDLYEVVEEQEV